MWKFALLHSGDRLTDVMGAVNSTEAATAVAQQNIVTIMPLDVTSVDHRSATACPVPGVGRQGKYSGSISDCPVLGGEASGGKFMSECPMSEEERQAYATDQVNPLNMVRVQGLRHRPSQPT